MIRRTKKGSQQILYGRHNQKRSEISWCGNSNTFNCMSLTMTSRRHLIRQYIYWKTLHTPVIPPLLYLTAGASQIETLSQKNIRGFIKTSWSRGWKAAFAFGLTVERIIYSYEAFIEAFGKGKVYVGKQVDIGDILDSDDLEEMEEKLTLKALKFIMPMILTNSFCLTCKRILPLFRQ